MTTEEQLRADFLEYTDSDGLVQPYKNPQRSASGNGLLYTTQFYITLMEHGYLTRQDVHNWKILTTKCWKERGLLNRSPIKTDQQGPDDYIGVLAAAYLMHRQGHTVGLRPYTAQLIYIYGKAFHWNYNNENPGKFRFASWFGRFPQLIAHIKWAGSYRDANWFEHIWSAGSTLIAAYSRPESHDVWILTYLRTLVSHNYCWLNRKANRVFRERLLKHYPLGIAQVLNNYFVNPDHPLAKYFITRGVVKETSN